VDLQLTGKRAVVTGGSRGIGLAVAEGLAAEGAHVALVARGREALDAAVARVSRHGTTVLARPTDATDDGDVRAMVAEVAGTLGGVDVLVNAAARPASSAPVPPLAGLTDDALRAEL
jgi:NAD(P)-dependent dehydrogenase (short-subunit alcohol dehydrogenase family)